MRSLITWVKALVSTETTVLCQRGSETRVKLPTRKDKDCESERFRALVGAKDENVSSKWNFANIPCWSRCAKQTKCPFTSLAPMVENERFTAEGSRCRQNFGFGNFCVVV